MERVDHVLLIASQVGGISTLKSILDVFVSGQALQTSTKSNAVSVLQARAFFDGFII